MKSFWLILFSGLALQLQAQNSTTTVPVGAVVVTITPSSGSAAQGTFFSAPLFSQSTASGQLAATLTSWTSTTLTNSAGGWTTSQLASASAPHFVRIKSGSAAGYSFLVTANTATTLTLDTQGLDLTTLNLTTSDTYDLVPGDTLLTLFGTPSVNNPIVGGTAPRNVDTVMIHDGAAWIPYYFNTTTNTWRSGNSPIDRGNVVIRPDQAIYFSRVGTSALSFTFSGTVPDVQRKSVLLTKGLTALATYFPQNQTLLGTQLHSLPGWRKFGDSGVTTDNADKVQLYNGTAWVSYYYETSSSSWKTVGSPDSQNAVAIPVGGALLLRRFGTDGTDTYAQALPYSL